MENHLKLMDCTEKTCYGYVDVLRNFFGVLITEEDQRVTCTMFNVFSFIFPLRIDLDLVSPLGLVVDLLLSLLQLNQFMIYAVSLHIKGYCSHFQD